MIRVISIAATILITLSWTPATAQTMDHQIAGALKLEKAWTRATPRAAKTGGGYITITNTGSEPDRLVSAKTEKSKKAEIHEMKVTDGVMKMRPLGDGLEIPAGATVELMPGRYHIMFKGLEAPITEGESVSVTLTFEKAGEVDVEMVAAPIGAREPMMDHSARGGHSGQSGQGN